MTASSSWRSAELSPAKRCGPIRRPAATSRRGNLRGTLDAIEHLLKRLAAGQVDRELDAARLAQVRVRIYAWHGKGAPEVDELRLRSLRLEQ